MRLAPFALCLLLTGCTVGYVDRDTNLCASLGAGSCSYDASDGSSDVRGAHVSVEAATLVASIADAITSGLRMMWGMP